MNGNLSGTRTPRQGSMWTESEEGNKGGAAERFDSPDKDGRYPIPSSMMVVPPPNVSSYSIPIQTSIEQSIGLPSPGLFDLFPDNHEVKESVAPQHPPALQRPMLPMPVPSVLRKPVASNIPLHIEVPNENNESPMISNIIEPQKYLPTSKDWSPFVRYTGTLEDDLSFLNSPTPHIPSRPPQHHINAGGGSMHTGLATSSSSKSSSMSSFAHDPFLSQHQSMESSPQSLWGQNNTNMNTGNTGNSNANNTSGASSGYSVDDLLAIQSARLQSNKLALQDRLKQTVSADTGEDANKSIHLPMQESGNIPMILNKRVKKTKPKMKADTKFLGGYNYSVGELASPGLAAITSAAEELGSEYDPSEDNYSESEGEQHEEGGGGLAKRKRRNRDSVKRSSSHTAGAGLRPGGRGVHGSEAVGLAAAESLIASVRPREIVVAAGLLGSAESIPVNNSSSRSYLPPQPSQHQLLQSQYGLHQPSPHQQQHQQQQQQQSISSHPLAQPSMTKKKVTCNCKRSRCLKLYCDCFRYEFYCDPTCNCNDCSNLAQYEDDRTAARKACIERNQDAFKPRVVKSGIKPDLAGCHCKKSACLKKYCECFTAVIPCTPKCQCVDCKNISTLYNPHSKVTHPFLHTRPGNTTSSSSYHQQPPPGEHSPYNIDGQQQQYVTITGDSLMLEETQLSQASMSSDLITASQTAVTASQSQETPSPADMLLQLAGGQSRRHQATPEAVSSSSSVSPSLYRRRNRSSMMSFSSFSLSVSGLNSPVIHSLHNTMQPQPSTGPRLSSTSASFSIPSTSLDIPSSSSPENQQQTPTSKKYSGGDGSGSTGVTPLFRDLSSGEPKRM